MVIDVAQAFGLTADPFARPPGADPERLLTLADAQRFVAERIAAAGGGPGLFTPAAIETAWRATAGRLGRLRWLCGLSMLEAVLDGAPRVDAAQVESAASRSVFTAPPPGAGAAGGVRAGAGSLAWSLPSRPALPLPGSVAAASLDPVRATACQTAAGPAVAAGVGAAPSVPRRRFGVVTMAGAAAGFLAVTLILFPPPVLKTPPSPLHPTHSRRVEPRPDILASADPSPALAHSAQRVPQLASSGDQQDRGFQAGRLGGASPSPGFDPDGLDSGAVGRGGEAAAQLGLRRPPAPAASTAAAPLSTARPPAPAADADGDSAAPVRAPVLVVVHYSAGDREAAEAFADTLERRGFAVSALREVDETPGRADARYFYDNDAGAAQAISRELSRFTGAPAPARSFERYGNPPAPGTIEVWLPPTG